MNKILLVGSGLCGAFFLTSPALAQNLPGSADPARLQRELARPPASKTDEAPRALPATSAISMTPPPGAQDQLFTLQAVEITGVSVFDADSLVALYADKQGKNISAAFLWELATMITQKYRDNGYILSRAYVPEQTIRSGTIRIDVVEGYIADVDIDPKYAQKRFVAKIINDLTTGAPLNTQDLESALLRLNGLYGMTFDASLGKGADNKPGSVTLRLVASKEQASQTTLSVNNHGSKYIGPYKATATLSRSFLDYHQTTLTAQTSVGNWEELMLAQVSHRMQVSPSAELSFLVSKTKSKPGHTLEEKGIESDSLLWGLGASWKILHQRDKNLTLSGHLHASDTDTNALGIPLTRDRVRALRGTVNYTFLDPLGVRNRTSVTLSRGLDALGASEEGELNLSRTNAKPTFTKLEADYHRQDALKPWLLLNTSLYGQWSSDSLFSSEEFGYGGVNLGRAFDSSEITGDKGLAASFELTYLGLETIEDFKVMPFMFYDVGQTWNNDDAVDEDEDSSASSVGMGARVYEPNGLGIEATLALPLSKEVEAPLYGNGKNPTLRLGIVQSF